jgi:hypothetical protein
LRLRNLVRRPLSGLEEHERLAGAFVDAIEREYRTRPGSGVGYGLLGAGDVYHDPWDAIGELESGRTLLEQPDDILASAVVVAATRPEVGQHYAPPARILAGLARRKLPFDEGHARLLLELALRADGWAFAPVLKPAVAAVEASGAQAAVRPLLERALAELDRTDVLAADRARLRGRLIALIGQVAGDDLRPLAGDDDWARRMRAIARERFPNAGPLLHHFAHATQSRPTAKWKKAAAELLERDGVDLVRTMLEQALESEIRLLRVDRWDGREYPVYLFLTDPSAVVVRGAIWAAGVLEAEWAPPLLARLARRADDERVANACVNVLGELATPEAVTGLTRLRATTRDRGRLKRIDAALDVAAERAGLSRSQLTERLVPDFGLDQDGRKRVRIGDSTAVVAAEGARAVLTWEDVAGRRQRSVPTAVQERHAEELKAVKAEVAELRKELAVQRPRLEGLLAEERRWPYDEWRRYYLDHPLVRALAERLYWVFDVGGEPVAALGLDAPEMAAEVELWHPIRASADEIAVRRRELVDREVLQPFKQAYREVYRLAPAELETRLYSNRFAGHVLRYPQAYALFKERGWSGNTLGPWDGGFDANMRRDFPAHRVRAEFYVEYAEWDDDGAIAALATTDQVRFFRTDVRIGEPLPLDAVPAVVFSEAMRDVDLFVGVTSIAADPEWADRGVARYDAYWRDTAFGELTASGETRRAALAEIVPKLKIADRCELGDRFLRIRGELRDYRIHLGSGNILMEPDDQFLCIVPSSTAKPRGRIFLPFEGDERLNVILSKAFLLARDRDISDRTIRRQIEGR